MPEKSPQAGLPAHPPPATIAAPPSVPAARCLAGNATPARRDLRGWRWFAAPVVALSLAACGGGHYDPYYDDGYGYDSSCNPNLYPAIEVRLVDATTGSRTIVGALGTVTDGRSTDEMSSPEPGYAVDGRASVLQGGFGMTGFVNVSVATRAGERYDWSSIAVTGNRCQVFTVVLEAPIHYPDP